MTDANAAARIRTYLAHYPRTSPARLVAERAARRIRHHAQREFRGRMLDLGCGAGWKRDLVGDIIETYVGLDHEASMHGNHAVDLVGTAYEIPQDDGAFDCVLCTSVLEHLEEPEAALREAWRVLTPGGVALYTVPQAWHLHEQPRDFFRMTPFGLRHLFEKTGFLVEVIEPMSGFWVHVGSEWFYHATAVAPRVARPLIRVIVAASAPLVRLCDRVDQLTNPRWGEWTWMNLVVAKKPGA